MRKRIICGAGEMWAKFNHFRHIFTNKHVAMKLRLKLLDAVVTPMILFGLMTMPSTQKDLNRLYTCSAKEDVCDPLLGGDIWTVSRVGTLCAV